MSIRQRGTWLKVRKTRDGSRARGNVGSYYIVDTFNNTVVDTHLATAVEARRRRIEMKKLPAYQGTVSVR